jgi:FtsZ-interacting cell division protein ZipA
MEKLEKYILIIIGAVALTALLIIAIKNKEDYEKCMITEKNEQICSIYLK